MRFFLIFSSFCNFSSSWGEVSPSLPSPRSFSRLQLALSLRSCPLPPLLDRERPCIAGQKQSSGLFLASLRAAVLRRRKRRRGRPSPRSSRQAVFRYPFCGGHPRNAPAHPGQQYRLRLRQAQNHRQHFPLNSGAQHNCYRWPEWRR